jgi:uncharacterized membrane protein
MIAELFFVLLFLTILNKEMKPINRKICFIIFSAALIVSHYAIAEIFMFFTLFVMVILIITKNPSMKITATMFALFCVMMFSWYLFTADGSSFDTFVSYGDYVLRSLGDIFSLESRDADVLRGLGLQAPPTILNAISRAVAYLVQFLIVMGFIGLLTKRVQLKRTLDKELFMLIIVAVVFLGLLIVVPGLPSTLNMTRFYHILLFFIAPLSVLGAKFLIGLVKRNNKFVVSVLLVLILVPYFLFQTGFVYEVSGNISSSESLSLPLSFYRIPAVRSRGEIGYISRTDVSSAEWVKDNINLQNMTVYADNPSRSYALLSFGMIHIGKIAVLSNVTTIFNNSITYLSRLNVVDGVIVGTYYVWNTTDFSFSNDSNKIYANGECEIYMK